jgi:uncharacterized protein (UPF0261 family)
LTLPPFSADADHALTIAGAEDRGAAAAASALGLRMFGVALRCHTLLKQTKE